MRPPCRRQSRTSSSEQKCPLTDLLPPFLTECTAHADALFDLLGFASLDAISEIIVRRGPLVTQLRDRITKLKTALSDSDGKAMPVYASSVRTPSETSQRRGQALS